MTAIADPQILEKCLGLLGDLKVGIESAGPDSNRDLAILTKLYGNCTTRNEKRTLFDRYRISLSIANCSEEQQQKNRSASPEQCRRGFLEELEGEIRRLERYKSIESERERLEALRRYVPDSSQPDRLLRYEAHHLRNIDRTETQLERLQRMRLGQQVLPKLEVHHSMS